MFKHDYLICKCSGTLEVIMKWSDVCTVRYTCLDSKVNDKKTYCTSSTGK